MAATASAQYAYNGLGYAGAAPLGYAGAAYAGAPLGYAGAAYAGAPLGYAGAGLGYAASPLGAQLAYAPAYTGAYAQAAPLAYAQAAPLAVAPAHAAYALPPVQEIQEAPLVSQTVEAVEQHGYSVRY